MQKHRKDLSRTKHRKQLIKHQNENKKTTDNHIETLQKNQSNHFPYESLTETFERELFSPVH